MTSKEIDKFRFGVFIDNSLISSLWFIDNWREEIYIGARGLSGQLKLSLHRSGICHLAFSAQYWKHLQGSGFALPQTREFIRWRRPETPSHGTVHVVTISFPSDFLTQKHELPQSKKPLFKFPAAPTGKTLELGLFFHRELPTDIEQQFSRIGMPIISLAFSPDEYVSVICRMVNFDPRFIPSPDKWGQINPLNHDILPSQDEELNGLGAILFNSPEDGKALHLTEITGLAIRRT